jgi:hypothetical protein
MKNIRNTNMFLKSVLSLSLVLATSTAIAQDKKMEELESRISELEAQSSLNIFKFSGMLETRYDAIKAKQTDPAASAFDGNTQYLRHRASIGIDADVNKYVKFYSRLTMSKFNNLYMNQQVGVGTTPTANTDLFAAKDERGPEVFFEKAYADAIMGDTGMVFSFGRLPTADGPPYELQNGRARMGTYPSLIYNAELDGVALTYNKQISEDQKVSIRGVHTPFTRKTDATGKSGIGIITNPTINGNSANTMIELGTVMAEYSVKNLSWAQGVSVIAQTYQTGKLPINASDIGGLSGAIEFKIGVTGFHLQIDNVAKSGFDLGFTTISTQIENNGVISLGPFGNVYGYGATAENDKAKGNASLISARYTINNANYIGAEYFSADKTAFVYDANNDSLTNFYSTPGKGTHVYYIYKFTPELGLRLGYMDQKYENTPFAFGASATTDRKITTYYSSLRLDF